MFHVEIMKEKREAFRCKVRDQKVIDWLEETFRMLPVGVKCRSDAIRAGLAYAKRILEKDPIIQDLRKINCSTAVNESPTPIIEKVYIDRIPSSGISIDGTRK